MGCRGAVGVFTGADGIAESYMARSFQPADALSPVRAHTHTSRIESTGSTAIASPGPKVSSSPMNIRGSSPHRQRLPRPGLSRHFPLCPRDRNHAATSSPR